MAVDLFALLQLACRSQLALPPSTHPKSHLTPPLPCGDEVTPPTQTLCLLLTPRWVTLGVQDMSSRKRQWVEPPTSTLITLLYPQRGWYVYAMVVLVVFMFIFCNLSSFVLFLGSGTSAPSSPFRFCFWSCEQLFFPSGPCFSNQSFRTVRYRTSRGCLRIMGYTVLLILASLEALTRALGSVQICAV